MKMKRLVLIILLAWIIPADCFAQDAILINSRDWRDVYSGMLYGSLMGISATFIVSQEDAAQQVLSLPDTYNDILIIENERSRYYTGLKGLVESRGFDATVISSGNLNLELADIADEFIIVSDQYGYNAISVLPYAIQTGSYVIFANDDNLRAVDDTLRGSRSVLLYGVLESSVNERLSRYSPAIINTGTRIANNQEIIRMFFENSNPGQVWLVSGDVLVKPIFSDDYPIMFIGRSAVPLEVDKFIAEHNVSSLVLIGNDLAPMVTQFKQRFENMHYPLIVTVLIGRSPRQIDFSGDQIQAIDTFRVPVPRLGIRISSVFYNQLDELLEVTYLNDGDASLFFQAAIDLDGSDGRQALGDEESVFLAASRSKTLIYPVLLRDASTSARFAVVFGEDTGTLDNLHSQSFDSLDFVTIQDNANVRITRVRYDRINNAFFVEVENMADVASYADIEIDVMIDGIIQTLYGSDIIRLDERVKRDVIIRQRLSPLDIADNQEVVARAFYSQRKESLSKVFEDRFVLGSVISPSTYAIGIGIIVLLSSIIALIIIFWKRRKIPDDY